MTVRDPLAGRCYSPLLNGTNARYRADRDGLRRCKRRATRKLLTEGGWRYFCGEHFRLWAQHLGRRIRER